MPGIMATGPLAQRDPERALVLARQAVALAPDQSLYLNTLGVALYGVGRYSEAIDVLERSLAAGRGETDAFDLFFLAMAHHGLGHRGQARTRLQPGRALVGRAKESVAPASSGAGRLPCRGRSRPGWPRRELPADVFAPP